MNLTMLGQTAMKVNGPRRIIAMTQALAGFMDPTWPATYRDGACRQQFVGEYEHIGRG